jgi:violaxanthin de-epoxidase
LRRAPQYEDDWYILASKPDEYVLVYYRGQNDAWKGYGGATVYTRSRALDPALVPELTKAAEAAGLDFSKFQLTDNSCPAKPPPRGLVAELEEDVEAAERFAAKEIDALERGVVDPSLRSFGRGFTILEKDLEAAAGGVVRELTSDEEKVVEEVEREAAQAARLIRRFQMEARMGKWVQLIPRGLREIIMPVQ